MKVIFLDVDGVLNSVETSEVFQGFVGIDDKLVSKLRKIVRALALKSFFHLRGSTIGSRSTRTNKTNTVITSTRSLKSICSPRLIKPVKRILNAAAKASSSG